jgi:hypothetical protein
MKVLGFIISIIQGLAIAAIYVINPAGVSYQAGWLILCMIGSVGPSVIVTAKGRAKTVGYIMEGLYLFALYQLYVWVMYYSGLPLL